MVARLLLAALLPTCHAWGRDGHAIVASIAAQRMSDGALQRVTELLGGASMASVSSWADDVRNQLPWSAPLHFVNSWCVSGKHIAARGAMSPRSSLLSHADLLEASAPLPCDFDWERDCHALDHGKAANDTDRCVAAALTNYTSRLLHNSSASFAGSADDLRLTIHFMGDSHQPLHVALAKDMGGVQDTQIQFDVPGQGDVWNLHQVWDFGLIVRSMNLSFAGSQHAFTADLLSRLTPQQVKEWTACPDATSRACVSAWAQETLDRAMDSAYVDERGAWIESGEALSDEYFETRLEVVRTQLLKGGVRLGVVLESVLGS